MSLLKTKVLLVPYGFVYKRPARAQIPPAAAPRAGRAVGMEAPPVDDWVAPEAALRADEATDWMRELASLAMDEVAEAMALLSVRVAVMLFRAELALASISEMAEPPSETAEETAEPAAEVREARPEVTSPRPEVISPPTEERIESIWALATPAAMTEVAMTEKRMLIDVMGLSGWWW